MADTVEKNIKLNIDSDIEPTLKNLRELKLALKSAAAGSDDFRKIQAKIDDVQDSLKGAKTSAGNFVDILGTVPGPLGDIGSKASGTIDILKSFGKLKLTDIKKSFMDLGGDLKDAGKGLANLTGLTKVYTKVNDFLSASFIKVGAAEGVAATGAKIFSAALIATGIGALVVGLGLAISALIEFASGEKEAAAEIDKFNAAIEASNIAIQNQTDNLGREHQKQIADLKARGASEKQIRDKELIQRKEDLVNAQNTEAKKLADLRAAYLIEDDDNREAAIEKANDDYRAATKTRKDLDTAYYVKAQENRAADGQDAKKQLEKDQKDAEDKRKQDIANYKKYKEDRRTVALEIAQGEIEIERESNKDILDAQLSYEKDSSKLAQDELKDRLKNKKITQKEYDDLTFQEASKLGLKLAAIEEEWTNKAKEANKALTVELADTAEERNQLEITAEEERISKIRSGLYKEFELKAQNSETFLEAQKVYLDKNRKLVQEGEENIAAINEKYAKQATDKAIADLKKQGEAEFLQKKADAEAARDLILNEEKSTLIQREQAERDFAETMRALQQKQLEDQIELLQKASGLSEEAKAANNLEILKLQDQLNQNLDSKYKENENKYETSLNKSTNAFLKNNEDKIKALQQSLEKASEALSYFSELSDAIEAKGLADIDVRYAADQEKQTNDLRALEELTLAQQQKYEADVLAAQGNSAALDEIEKSKQMGDYNTQNSIRLNKEATADLEYKIALDQDKVRKKNFENQKAFNIANAIISAVQGSISAFTSLAPIPIVGPVLGAIAAAAALATGYLNVKTIQAQQYQPQALPPPVKGTAGLPPGTETGGGGGGSGSKRAQGGLLTGRTHAEGGIPTSFGELEGGEYVVNRSATESFLPLLDKINGMGKGSGAPSNLSVMGEQNINGPAPIIKTYVVASDMTSQQEANKRLEDIARL